MRIMTREQLQEVRLPGRAIQLAVGKEGGASPSEYMTMGFARYAAESGPMEPHSHAEEIVYILSAQDGWVRAGPARDSLGDPIPLQAGMVLHIPEGEWHVFQYAEGGHVDILFFYSNPEAFASHRQ